MRATDYSQTRSRRKDLWPQPVRSARVETLAFGTLGVAVLLAILIAFMSASMPPGVRKDPLTDSVRYLRSGQLSADLRSACAMAQFLLANSTAPPTNEFPLRAASSVDSL